MLLAVVVGAALAGFPATVEGSRATAPGTNGWIVFGRSNALFVLDPRTRREREITHPPPQAVDADAEWAPDRSLVVFDRCPANGACAIYSVRPDGRALRRLSSPCPAGAQPPACRDEYGPAFSPDGRRVVFASYTSGNGNAIVVTDRRGRHRRVLVPKHENVEVVFPQLSPDGKRLVFGRHIGNRYAVFIAHSDGAHARQLTRWSLNGGDADWSPDGRSILFRSGVPEATRSRLYLIRPDGSALRSLTKPRVTVTSSPSFSPDGKLIVYAASGTSGQPDLFVMRRSGTAVRRLTRTRLAEAAPDWGPAPR